MGSRAGRCHIRTKVWHRGYALVAVRDAKPDLIMSLLIECNASGDPKQIRKTVNRGRLHAGINHNPNFIRCACRHRHLSLAAKTLTLAAIVKCREVEASYQRSGTSTCSAAC